MSEIYGLMKALKVKENIFAIIKVVYPVGAICTCVNGDIVLQAQDTSGEFVFEIPESGVWTIRATDGISEDQVECDVNEQYKFYSYKLDFGWDGVPIDGRLLLYGGKVGSGVTYKQIGEFGWASKVTPPCWFGIGDPEIFNIPNIVFSSTTTKISFTEFNIDARNFTVKLDNESIFSTNSGIPYEEHKILDINIPLKFLNQEKHTLLVSSSDSILSFYTLGFNVQSSK